MSKTSHLAFNFDQYQGIISDIYDAALDPHKWNAVLKKIALMLKAESAYMRTIKTKSNNVILSYNYNKDLDWLQTYKDYYIHKDPWLNGTLKAKKTFIACTHHLLTDKKYETMEYYRGFVAPQNIHYGVGGKIIIEKDISSYLAFNRDRKRQGFEDEYLETLKLLTPHMQKALLINEKTRNLEIEKNSFSDSLNLINSSLILVNKSGQVLFINPQAEQFITQQSSIRIKNNHLIISSSIDHKNLGKLIQQATDTCSSLQQGGGMCFTDPVTLSPISILACPINPDMVHVDTQSNENVLLVLSTDQQQKLLPTELLAALYKFTPSEARLAAYLCQGLTLDEISEKIELSRNTLKSQLRSCFTKTGVSRQAELIRLINTGPAGIIKTT